MAKMKSKERTATAADRSRKAQRKPATFTSSDVALRAFEIFVARGCEDGHDVEDWLQAERELSRPTAD